MSFLIETNQFNLERGLLCLIVTQEKVGFLIAIVKDKVPDCTGETQVLLLLSK